MVLKGAATMLIRISRAVISRPIKSTLPTRLPDVKKITRDVHLVQKPTTRYYLFPSIHRTFFSTYGSTFGSTQQAMSNLMPFRAALNEIKRRLFFAAPTSSRLILSLLGYSLLPQSTLDLVRLDKTLDQIAGLLSKSIKVDRFDEENQVYHRQKLDDYELGRLLGCGCNAAVYEARLRTSSEQLSSLNLRFNSLSTQDDDTESDIDILSRQSSNSSCFDDDNYNHLDDEERLNELSLKEVRYRASTNMYRSSHVKSDILPAGQFNLAIKMLFNYGIQSNDEALRKAMDKELIPLHKPVFHPNIVRMYSYFVDSFPLLKEAHDYYPMAIPTNLSPEGFGRNKTLFIVMRRYDTTLNEYIREKQPNQHDRLVLFAQLLEALLYLKRHSIVHRDLKSDNLLVCSSTGELVLADFGCALHQSPDLRVPYVTDETGKGGNLALMAPEIVSCQPGPKNFLDYSKADLWASGTLFYEFFSLPNPFFHGALRQETYDDQQLPPLSPLASPLLEQLVYRILRRNPNERPSISLVSDCIHLCLWLKWKASSMSKNELYQKYMWTSLETLFHKRLLSTVELNLKQLFFQRQSTQTLYNAQSYLERLSTLI